MAGVSREQALSLLSAAKNRNDLAVKISSLKQARDILLSLEPSLASEIFPYLAELESSPESLVRKVLIELVEELGLKQLEHSFIFMPILLKFLKDDAPTVVRQSLICGTSFFCHVLEHVAMQFHQTGKVERWLEELWLWMLKLKDAVHQIALKSGSVATRLLAVKFLEISILLLTHEGSDFETSTRGGKRWNFSSAWLPGGHPALDHNLLMSEANRTIAILFDLLQSANTLRGSLTIVVINCLAAVARKRPLHYSSIISALLAFDPNFDMLKGGHSASVQYALRTAFLGFLRCTHSIAMESRDRLLKYLRAMNAGDAADQVIRQVEKIMKNNDRMLRDVRFIKEDAMSNQLTTLMESARKRSLFQDNEVLPNMDDENSKRTRYNPPFGYPSQVDPVMEDNIANGDFSKTPPLDSLTPVEQMIAMIGALLAEGERGAESLEILISKIHPDLLADIVIANMKNLAKHPPPLSNTHLLKYQTITQNVTPPSTVPVQAPHTSQGTLSLSISEEINISASDMSQISAPPDSRRDPRRDPRLDPRRSAPLISVQSVPAKIEEVGENQSTLDNSIKAQIPVAMAIESTLVPSSPQSDTERIETSIPPLSGIPISKVESPIKSEELKSDLEVHTPSDSLVSPNNVVDQDVTPIISWEVTKLEVFSMNTVETDQQILDTSTAIPSEESSIELPAIPSYVDLSDEDQRLLCNLAIGRVIDAFQHIHTVGLDDVRLALLARLTSQTDADDDMIALLQKHILPDYHHQKGHEVAMHVLYHLHSVVISESNEWISSYAARIYEKFLLAVAKSLWDILPSSDKSFSRLLGEAPFLPDSVLMLLENFCHVDVVDHGKDSRDGDRITQGLGAVWSLILGRPVSREACLNIALKCAVHLKDDVRAKAIRLVANKLYVLSYLSETIEQFATNKLLEVVGQRVADVDSTLSICSEQKTEVNATCQETSISGSQNSEPVISESDSVSVKNAQSYPSSSSSVTSSEAQQHTSLFFALCTKKPSLLQLIFDIYGQAPRAVKQSVHRHIPILMRNLGSSYSELLRIISDPPQGSDNLLIMVLQILTEETTPSAELISTVKHLYQTKLKDAAILIPMLSSFSKAEVLPIFPQLVNLPLDKFQIALARILQGSTHTGPALTPTEVLVAIHHIEPEKDQIALKKITDACSACFEQRTVFTQQVLAKALNQMVEQIPLPLLFMRTVIQAIDAFPTLVDFVMEILSKLVSKQIWKIPKLWVGFLKCASQTQPHSFGVLLQLPPVQLESTLNKYTNLRAPLASYANQPNIRSSLPRSTLAILGLSSELQASRPYTLTPFHPPDTSSSVHGTT